MQLPNPFLLPSLRPEADNLRDTKAEQAAVQCMVEQTKTNLGDNAFDLLLWGWLVLAAALGQYVLAQLHYARPWLPWPVLMPLGGIVAVTHNLRRIEAPRPASYAEHLLLYLWVGFTVLLLLILGLMLTRHISPASGHALVLGLYGLGTFASGGALRFRPLVYGAVACWALALGALSVPVGQLPLLLALGVSLAYIGPGHLLRSRYRQRPQPASVAHG